MSTLEKSAHLVPCNRQVCFDFLRYLWPHKSDPVGMRLFESMLLDFEKCPTEQLFVGLVAAVQHPEIRMKHIYEGMLLGVCLALASSDESTRGNLGEFLKHYKASGENVANIADALRKRGV